MEETQSESQAGAEVERYLMDKLGYSQSGDVVLAIRAAGIWSGFNAGFGLVAISSTEVYIVSCRTRSSFGSPYFQKAMQTAHLCWWKNNTFEKELSVSEFNVRMDTL